MFDLLVVMAFGLFGGVIRVLIGFAKSYEYGFVPQRAWLSLVLAALCGALAAILIAEDPKVAVIAGLGGPDMVEALWRGLARKVAGGSYAAATAGAVPIWITNRQMKGLDVARRKGGITTKQYAEAVGVSLRTAERDLSDLTKAGLLMPKGKGRGAHYVAVKRK
ncbi:MAG: DeoR family transcriptional regulator [Candidatus Aenigmatarchaeota archaeon]